MSSYTMVPVVQGVPLRAVWLRRQRCMQADGLPQQAKSPSLVPLRIDSSMIVRGASCICLSPEAQKKTQIDGLSWGLCWQLAEMCSATRWPSTEGTRLMGGGLGSSAAEWSM